MTDAPLKPCPFCGGPASVKCDDLGAYYTTCDAEQCGHGEIHRFDYEAAQSWNRRPDAATAQAVQRLRAVEGELRPTTNRTTQAKVMISQYSEDWHKWADEIAAVADSLEWK